MTSNGDELSNSIEKFRLLSKILLAEFDAKFCGEFTKKMSGRNATNACKTIIEKLPEIANKIGEYVEGLHFESFQQSVKTLENTVDDRLQRDISRISDGFESKLDPSTFS